MEVLSSLVKYLDNDLYSPALMWGCRAATAYFWQARKTQWRPHQRHADAAFFLQNPEKA